jgi:WD repeat-containing protein 61
MSRLPPSLFSLTPRHQQLLISGSDDKRICLHDIRTTSNSKSTGGAVAYLSGHAGWVVSTDVNPNSKLILSGYVTPHSHIRIVSDRTHRSCDKTIKIWDIGQRAAVSTAQDTGDVWSVSWRPIPPEPGHGAGSFITAGEDGNVKWWRSAGAAS